MCIILDTEARFGKISIKLRTQSAKTLPELEEAIQCCLSSGIDTAPKIFNIRDWMIPHLNHVHNHSHPHLCWDNKNYVRSCLKVHTKKLSIHNQYYYILENSLLKHTFNHVILVKQNHLSSENGNFPFYGDSNHEDFLMSCY